MARGAPTPRMIFLRAGSGPPSPGASISPFAVAHLPEQEDTFCRQCAGVQESHGVRHTPAGQPYRVGLWQIDADVRADARATCTPSAPQAGPPTASASAAGASSSSSARQLGASGDAATGVDALAEWPRSRGAARAAANSTRRPSGRMTTG